jgi:hypothetical protein
MNTKDVTLYSRLNFYHVDVLAESNFNQGGNASHGGFAQFTVKGLPLNITYLEDTETTVLRAKGDLECEILAEMFQALGYWLAQVKHINPEEFKDAFAKHSEHCI